VSDTYSYKPELCGGLANLELFWVLLGHLTTPPTPKC
jgi:hypothetical protein